MVFPSLPLMNLRGSVLYPGMEMTIVVGRPETVRAIRTALAKFDGRLIVISQRHIENNGPILRHDMFDYGCSCQIEKSIFMTDGSVKVHLQAENRVRLIELLPEEEEDIALARVQSFDDALTPASKDAWEKAAVLAFPKTAFDVSHLLTALFRNEKTAIDAVDLKLLNEAVATRQGILEAIDMPTRLRLIDELRAHEPASDAAAHFCP